MSKKIPESFVSHLAICDYYKFEILYHPIDRHWQVYSSPDEEDEVDLLYTSKDLANVIGWLFNYHEAQKKKAKKVKHKHK